MSIFIAVPLPASVKKTLSEAQVPNDAIRWQKPDNFHITLQFIGNLSEEKLNVLTEQLVKVNHQAFSLAIRGWGIFPEKGRVKIVWAAIAPVQEILKLHGAIHDKCYKIGIEDDDRPFVPHVTMGRAKQTIRQKEVKLMLEKPAIEASPFWVDTFAVYKSEHAPDGAFHKTIKEYSLSE